MRRRRCLRTAMNFLAAFVAIGTAAMALEERSKEPKASAQGEAEAPKLTLQKALDARPEFAKLFQNLQTAVRSGTQLSQREQLMLLAVVASRNHCLY